MKRMGREIKHGRNEKDEKKKQITEEVIIGKPEKNQEGQDTGENVSGSRKTA